MEKMNDFIGQDKIVTLLKTAIEGAIKRKKSIGNILLYSRPGYGKTTIAKIIACEMNSRYLYVSAPTISKIVDIVSIFTSLKKNDVLFIDEVQRLPIFLEEILYSAMEEHVLRFLYQNEENSKPIEIELEDFTLIAATTNLCALSAPFRSRFSYSLTFEEYTEIEIEKIVDNYTLKEGYSIDAIAKTWIANISRKCPRNAKNYCNILFNIINQDKKTITVKDVNFLMNKMNIYENGLTQTDIKILKALYYRFNSNPVSLKAIANIVGISPEDIENVYEPYLVENKYVDRTKKGRMITHKGIYFITKNSN